jgi:cell fate regulator YaaT (PSP1 superfamily)
MGCGSCGTGGCGSTKSPGCNNNGGCSTGGCNKLNSYDWLSDILVDTLTYNVIEVRFKGGRKEFFRNPNNLDLTIGDPVMVEAAPGFHLGFVSLTGELVRLQMKKKEVADNDEIKKIVRFANTKDFEKYEVAKARELSTLGRTREVVNELKLDMKLSDVEFQGDNTKATFYYSAEERVDFRELIKRLADEFKVRVEMRQISLRQEAGRVGGIGVCGRELCCSSWLTTFKNVSTSAARYQNLSINPQKLSGQCGRLKCCLNYELDTYMDALKDIPEVEKPIKTARGNAVLQKTDIFKRMMWFSFDKDDNWYPVSIERVVKLLEMNKEGIFPEQLSEEEIVKKEVVKENDFVTGFSAKRNEKNQPRNKKNKPKNPNNNQPNKQNQPQTDENKNVAAAAPQAENKNKNNNKKRFKNKNRKPNTPNENPPKQD